MIISGGEVTIVNRNKDDSIRILALGESTTDKRFLTKDNKAWPEHLEEIGKSYGLKLNVYNHGRSAITSNEILNDLDELIGHYNPHFVITMIGINDSNSWALDVNRSFLGKLKIYRLASWIYWSTYNLFSYRPLPNKDFNEDNLDPKNLTNKEKSQYYAYLAKKTAPFLPLPMDEVSKDDKYRKAKDYYKKSMEAGYFVEEALGHYLWLLVEFGYVKECSDLIKNYVEKGGILNYFELMSAQTCLLDNSESQRFLKENQENLAFAFVQNAGLFNYKRINKKIADSGASHVVMQYPMLSIQKLKQIFKDEKKIYYVENLRNFEEALSLHAEGEVFIDKFAGEFGHTTELGHKLIAQEIIQTLLPALKAHD